MPGSMMLVRPGLALALAESGRDADARLVLAECAAADGIERRARTVFGRVELTLLGYAAALVDDSGLAERVYDALRARSGQVAAWAAWAFWGAFDAVLGVLALHAQRPDDAVEHLDAALTLHERAGWRALAAMTATDLADALLARGLAGDRDRAAVLVARTEPVAVELGLERVRERLVSLRAQRH
jgi:hypothetical protein